ncbi:MAG: phenylalanine--tRNA ligase subunit alpha, partial [Saprospiraceae bacterium]|nr:phenylalanine--tRNA ligase subunit alpha [Saprospiraceae bacterium]
MSAAIFDQVRAVLKEIEQEAPQTLEALEQFRIRYVGSKNVIKPLFDEIKNVANEQKREFGQLINSAKQAAEAKFNALKEQLESVADAGLAGSLDLTAP